MTEELNLEIIKKTQDSLGKYIKRPPLTEKLLKKPPFRFLHDIITNVINETGFLKGLYDNNEMQSENIKDRDTKIAFLQKLIDALKITTNEKLTVKPSKIIAGLEPAKTNQLLQIIGNALEKKLDSTEAVHQITGTTTLGLDKKLSKTKIDDKIKQKKNEDSTKRLARKNTEEKLNIVKKKQSPRTEKENRRNSVTSNEKSTKNKPIQKQETKEKESPTEKKLKEIKSETLIDQTSTSANVAPKTEQISTMEILEEQGSVLEPSQKDNPSEKTTEIVKLDVDSKKIHKKEFDELHKLPTENSLKQELVELQTTEQVKAIEAGTVPIRKPSARLRPPSVRPTSARPAAPRLRDKMDTVMPADQLVTMGKVQVIVENAAQDEDNEETVRVETPADEVAQYQVPLAQDIPAERGHLVQQILEQIGEQKPVMKQFPKIKDSHNSATLDEQRITQSIQTLTRAANPLGKLVSYMHEDVDSMLSELRTWKTVNKNLRGQVTDIRKNNQEATRPLLQQLERLDADIERQRSMIHTTQANVLRNQQKIKQLLTRE